MIDRKNEVEMERPK